MSQASVLPHPAIARSSEHVEPARSAVSDSPWLFFVAPVSFALTLIVCSWISLNSF